MRPSAEKASLEGAKTLWLPWERSPTKLCPAGEASKVAREVRPAPCNAAFRADPYSDEFPAVTFPVAAGKGDEAVEVAFAPKGTEHEAHSCQTLGRLIEVGQNRRCERIRHPVILLYLS